LAKVVAFRPVQAKQILEHRAHFQRTSYLATLTERQEVSERAKGIP
jgi:hypothetical protein